MKQVTSWSVGRALYLQCVSHAFPHWLTYGTNHNKKRELTGKIKDVEKATKEFWTSKSKPKLLTERSIRSSLHRLIVRRFDQECDLWVTSSRSTTVQLDKIQRQRMGLGPLFPKIRTTEQPARFMGLGSQYSLEQSISTYKNLNFGIEIE